ncbi:MerR family transcriptional regulator [Brevibacillus parabrevis]|uniref:MerR family transcriptional regulator n=1 Tax=Brevibacillus parabrevis TaxID=54914 RepID=UPI0028D6FB64|nr:MerR family transcriptional regulator [Brevibacillus parabrevis]MED1721998.1 MerR family transcriptional regulator [Brevibacillus parabrevis]
MKRGVPFATGQATGRKQHADVLRAGWQAESGEAWLTIKEASRKTGLPSSTIRHWEKTGLITTTRDPRSL